MSDSLYGSELQVLDFADLDLSGNGTGTYKGVFAVEFDIAAQFPLSVVEAEAEGSFPQFVRGDPQSKVIPVLIHLRDENNQAMIDALKTAFSPSGDIDYLRVLDADGNVRRMRAKSLGLVPYRGDDQYNYVASLEAPEPVWEADTASVIFYNVSGNASVVSKSWEVTNGGNEECQPVITVTPYANRSSVGSDHMRPIVIAWRSSLEGVDSQGYPYPIDVTDGLWDSSSAPDWNGDDAVRLWLDGAEINRYIVNGNTTGTSVWASIPFQPARIGELALNITGTVTSMELTDPDDLAAFPDVGFLLVDSECIAYQGKTALTFSNLRRGQRGTSPASHTAGATVYWVEHDIRLSWGAYTSGIASGLQSADEKPIIDLAASTNLHHMYGTTDGLIEPESLRPGQWIRELRAPSNGRRAQYASLGQTAGVVEFVDQLPEAGAPNFDSLSLYTPCFVSSNMTGVALDASVDHVMACALYGVDAEGFETLLHKRDCLGWLPSEGMTDGNPREDYLIGDPAFVTIDLLPDDDLTRLTISGYSGALVGIWKADGTAPVASFSAGDGGLECAQELTMQEHEPRALLFAIVPFGPDYTAFDGDLFARSQIVDGDPSWSTTFSNIGINNADLPAPVNTRVPITVEWGSDNTNVLRFRGQLGVNFNDGSTASAGHVPIVNATPPRYSSGSAWQRTGGVWVESLPDDLYVMVSDGKGVPQTDADLGTEFDVQVKNVDVHFNPDFTPLIVMGAQASCYTLQEQVLTNTDTGESIILTGILPIDAVQTHDIAKMDTGARMATVVRDLYTDYEQAAGYFADPSDIQAWIRLIPGVNHITMSALGGGPREAVKFYFRSRWT